MQPYVLGLDLGPNSIGWALIAWDPEGRHPVGLLDTKVAGHEPLGVRIFSAGLQNFGTAKEQSASVARRVARSARRTLARRRARRSAALEVLVGAQLLPQDPVARTQIWRRDPYELRAAALERPLTDEELGRALYHLSQRRGFASNRRQNPAEDKEEAGLLQEISQLEGAMRLEGARSLGEFLWRRATRKDGVLPVRLRARQAGAEHYADKPRRAKRDMLQREFDLILDRQEELRGAPPMTGESREALRWALFFQHPFEVDDERRAKQPPRANLHRAPSVRPCPFEPGERCCSRGDWISQQFRILKEVANLRVSEEYASERALTAEERRSVVDLLSESRQVKFGQLEKALARRHGLRQPIEFNLARGERAALLGNEVNATLAKALGKKAWSNLDNDARHALRVALDEDAPPKAVQQALARVGVDDPELVQQLERYAGRSDGYLGFSKRALGRIVPLLERGLNEYEAIREAYPQTFRADGFAQLPSLAALATAENLKGAVPPALGAKLTNIANPVVERCLVEVRKVVNALVREHGRPEHIVVELARDLKAGPKRRREVAKRMRDRETHREQGRRFLREYFSGAWPKREDVDRWALWEEQRHECPYCGRALSAQEAFSSACEVDHILPRWKSLDDSMNNKVLACSPCNAEKRDRTPLEWLGGDTERGFNMLKRVRRCSSSAGHPHGMPPPKVERFEREEIDADEFASSQLNDTRYISSLVAEYLLLLYPTEMHTGQKAVRSSPGGLTARLRREWGLNDVIPPLVGAGGEVVSDVVEMEGWTKKLRIDHRHHAVDALVIGLSSRTFVQRLQRAWHAREQRRLDGVDFPLPWSALRDDVQQAVARIVVSHRPRRRLRGPLHDQTYLGAVDPERGEYVTRKTLSQLTSAMIPRIRDQKIRNVIEGRLAECGWSPEAKKLPKDWWREPLYLPVAQPRPGRTARTPHPIWRVRVTETVSNAIALGDRAHRFARPGENHRLEVIYSETEGFRFRTVSRFVARRVAENVDNPSGASDGTVMALHRGDVLLVHLDGIDHPVMVVVQNLSSNPEFGTSVDIQLRDARDARPSSKENHIRIASKGKWSALRARRVDIDPIGRLQNGSE